jgi:hypothetical protein
MNARIDILLVTGLVQWREIHPCKPRTLAFGILEAAFKRIAFVNTATTDTFDNICDMREWVDPQCITTYIYICICICICIYVPIDMLLVTGVVH